jgi:carbonic anhydrase/acetyltransferase-like protein (isoleucine patch superfamily)
MLGAIIIRDRTGDGEEQVPSSLGLFRSSWATTEILGRTPIARLADQFRKNGCDLVSLIANASQDDQYATGTGPELVPDLAHECLAIYRQKGVENVLIVRCGAYVEIEIAEMLSFHQKQGMGVTRAINQDHELDFWIADASWFGADMPILAALLGADPVMYASRGYVNQLQTPGDFRRLVLDGLNSRCGLCPQGSEIRPGVWIGEGAQVDRSARVVAPAFIGRNVLISGECLITRGSNVESNCLVDFGTAVEDSSILSNSYLGIGLDVCNSIVDGTNLFNLRHNVNVEISDPVVMRKYAVRERSRHASSDIQSGEMALSATE